MYCKHCGQIVSDGSLFCFSCGGAIDDKHIAVRTASGFDTRKCVQELETALPALVQLENNYEKISLYSEQSEHAGRDLRILALGISAGGGMFAAWLVSRLFALISSGLGGLIFLLAWPAAGFFLYRFCRPLVAKGSSSEKASAEEKLQEYQARYEDQFEIVYPVLSKYVPEDYWYSNAVQYICYYFRNRRADSMKEAINLYEEEMHRLRLESAAELTLIENQKQTANSAMAVFLLATSGILR